jgi:hypothetical protein
MMVCATAASHGYGVWYRIQDGDNIHKVLPMYFETKMSLFKCKYILFGKYQERTDSANCSSLAMGPRAD